MYSRKAIKSLSDPSPTNSLHLELAVRSFACTSHVPHNVSAFIFVILNGVLTEYKVIKLKKKHLQKHADIAHAVVSTFDRISLY